MIRFNTVLLATVVSAMLVLTVGCQKKLTKVTPSPETPAPVEAAPTAPPPAPPAERESFETVDAEATLRAALQTVYFDYDKSDLQPATIDRLQIIGKLMDDKKNLNLLLEGHTDERGTSEYNIGLGQRRSASIRSWLINYGIADRRLETTSYGKERASVSNCSDDDCHGKNRRVEFKVLSN